MNTNCNGLAYKKAERKGQYAEKLFKEVLRCDVVKVFKDISKSEIIAQFKVLQ